MSNFRGIWIALVTPMRDNEIDFRPGAVGEEAARRRRGRFCGVRYHGEAAALSKAEQLAVLDAVLAWVEPGRVVMGLSGYNLRELLGLQAESNSATLAGCWSPHLATFAHRRPASKPSSPMWPMPPACQ
jgi:4-hydroxy-tetrahydrodipicolinate synthase